MRFQGKIAIVTGGGSGIGEAIVLALAKEGADVVVSDIDLPAAESVSNKVKSIGRMALPLKVDVTSKAQVNAMVEKTMDVFKKIDILVNNAGITKMALPEEESEEQWDQTIDINLKGQFLCSQAVGRQMIKQRHGKIVNIASTSGSRGTSTSVAYSASKGGVLALTKGLAVNWAKYNINVNAVSPGFTLTPIVEKAVKTSRRTMEDFVEDMVKYMPLKRPNKAEDIANAVLFLASSDADNMVGQEIVVDGGSLAVHPSHALAVNTLK